MLSVLLYIFIIQYAFALPKEEILDRASSEALIGNDSSMELEIEKPAGKRHILC